MNKKKIFLHLNGGLGNQLFQYAAARNLAIIHNAQLIIDTETSRLFEIKRKIKKFFYREEQEPGEVYDGCQLVIRKTKNVKFVKISLIFLFYRILKKIFFLKKKIYSNQFFVLYDDTNFLNKINFKKINFGNKLYLFGFFQSKKYFEFNKKSIIKEILPCKVNEKKYKKILKNLRKKSSVVLGIRYHKSLIYRSKYKNVNQNFNFYKKSISKILYKIKKPTFYIFSTKNEYANYIIKKIKILKKFNKIYITSDNGYHSAYKSFWLMSYAQNQIISSSTMYWWSAYISWNKYKESLIFCDNKFPEKKTIIQNWKL